MARKMNVDFECHFWSASRGIWTKHLVFRMNGNKPEERRRENGICKKWRFVPLKPEIKTIDEIRHILLVDGNANQPAGGRWVVGPPPRGAGTCPSMETLRRCTLGDENAPTPCPNGCEVEPDGKCEHGYTAWPRLVGIV